MRSILRESLRFRTTLVFLVAIVIIMSVQMMRSCLKHVEHYHQKADLSGRATSDAVLLTSSYPGIVPWPSATASVRRRMDASPVETKNQFTITPLQRSLHIVNRLARFTGTGRGFARVSHLLISLIGILGMFSAVVGALIGPWLADTGEEFVSDDRFIFWAREEEDDEDDERICGLAREEKYGMYRVLDVT